MSQCRSGNYVPINYATQLARMSGTDICGNSCRDLRHFKRMSEARAIKIRIRVMKELRFALQPPETGGMDQTRIITPTERPSIARLSLFRWAVLDFSIVIALVIKRQQSPDLPFVGGTRGIYTI